MYIFISYSSKNIEIAKRVVGHIEDAGMTCFLAPRDVRTGYVYAEEILNALDKCDKVVLLLSEDSNVSAHVLREIERAVSTGKPIITYRLQELKLTKAMEYFLMVTQWLDADEAGTDRALLQAIADAEESADTRAEKKNEAAAAENAGTVSEQRAETSGEPQKETEDAGRKEALKVSMPMVIIGLVLILIATIFLIVKLTQNKLKDIGESVPDSVETKTMESREPVPVEYEIGDTVVLGTYAGQPIEWRVLHFEEDGSAILISKYVLCFKAFDGAESGKCYYTVEGRSIGFGEAFSPLEYVESCGDNDWSASNLRYWLNSADEVVPYVGQPPYGDAMWNHNNPYKTEEGFLYFFTEEDREYLMARENGTIHRTYSEDALWIFGETEAFPDDVITETEKVTEDLVFLLSIDELVWFDEAGISIFAEPTAQAVEADQNGLYADCVKESGLKWSYWWTRDERHGSPVDLLVVRNGSKEQLTEGYKACVEGIGVRPAVKVDLKALGIRDAK